MIVNEREFDQLAPVELYAIPPQQADRFGALLTDEALAAIRREEGAALVVAEEGVAQGAVCGQLSREDDRVLELLSLYVAPDHRRRGLGSTLLLELLDFYIERTGGELRRVEIAFTGEQEELSAFLARAGFAFEDIPDTGSWLLPVSALKDTPLMTLGKARAPGYTMLPAGELPDVKLRQLAGLLERHGADYLSAEEYGKILPRLSHVLFNDRQEPVGCALFTRREQVVCLSQFFISTTYPALAGPLLYQCGRAAQELLEGDVLLEIPTVTQSSLNLTRRLLGEAARCRTLTGAMLDLY